MEFQEAVAQRFATKKFDGRSLPKEKLDELLELVRLSASALNMQPWKIKIVSDPALKAELAPLTGNKEMVETASHVLVFCADTDAEALVAKMMAGMEKAGVPQHIKDHVLDLSREMFLSLDLEGRKVWATHQVYLALGNAVNGAKALGFDSCPVTHFQPDEFARILDIPAHLYPVVICPLGYAAHPASPKMRFPVEEIVF